MRFLEWEPFNCFEEFSSGFFLFDLGPLQIHLHFLNWIHRFVCPGTTTEQMERKNEPEWKTNPTNSGLPTDNTRLTMNQTPHQLLQSLRAPATPLEPLQPHFWPCLQLCVCVCVCVCLSLSLLYFRDQQQSPLNSDTTVMVKHLEKFPSKFGGHLTFDQIPLLF
jgi:hypothetical protein